MRERVDTYVPGVAENRTFIGTFHAFCTQTLRQHGSHVNVFPDFGIYDQKREREALLGDALRAAIEAGREFSMEDIAWLNGIDEMKARLVVPEKVGEKIRNPHMLQVYQLYEEALERVRHRQNQKGDSQGSQKVIQAMRWVKGGQPWMTRPYSEDLRERVVRVVESGTSRNAAAKQFDVSISFVVKLMQRWKQRGTIKADKYGGWKKSKLAPHGDRIRALVMENCDITIDELCVLLAAEGIEAKRSTLGDFLLAQGLSRKKRQPTPPSRSALTSRRREPLGATSNLG